MLRTVPKLLAKKAAKNSLLNVTGRGGTQLISYGFIAYLNRQLDETEFGAFALLFVFYSLVGMASSLGLPAAAIRLIPEMKEKGDTDKVSDIIKITMLISSLVALAVVIVGVGLAGPLTRLFTKSAMPPGIMIWILLASLFYCVFDKAILVLQSLQEFGKIAFLLLLAHISQRVFAIVLLLTGYGLKGILCGFLLGGTLGAILAVWYLRRYLLCPYNNYRVKAHLRFSLPYYGQDASRFMFSQADQMLIPILFTLDTLAVYFVAKKGIAVVLLAFNAVLEAVIPRLAEIKARGQAALKDNLDSVYSLLSWVALTAVILLFLNSKTLMVCLGTREAGSFLLLNILGVATFIYMIFSLVSIGVYLAEPPRDMLKLFLSVGASNMVVSSILGLLFGLNAFAWAQCSGFLIGIVLVRYTYRKRWLTYVWKQDVVFAILMGMMFALGYGVNQCALMVGDNVLSRFVIPIAVNVAFFLSVVYILYSKREVLSAWFQIKNG